MMLSFRMTTTEGRIDLTKLLPPKFGKLVLGSVDADFAIKGAIFSVFRDRQDLHPFAPLRSKTFNKKSASNFNIFF